jgi:hypothetical protein
MLGERQVAAPLMARRAAHGAVGPSHRRFQPGAGVGVQLAGLRPGRQHRLLPPGQLGHEALVLGFALVAPAASRPGQHGAVRRERGRNVAPGGHSLHGRAAAFLVAPRVDQGTGAEQTRRALDGFNIHIGHPAQFRRFADPVAPILRERGLVRADYESSTLRGNLGIPVPQNRYTRARREAADDPAAAVPAAG